MTRALLALALAGLLMGCGSSSGSSSGAAESTGYAASVQAATDRAAQLVLPALVQDLGTRVRVGKAGFVECDLGGWRYQADGDLMGGSADAAAVPALLQGVMEEQDLTVEVRADGSVVGRKGELSLLVGARLGPPARPFRHYTFTHACADYSDADADYARTAPETDHTAYVPPAARYLG